MKVLHDRLSEAGAPVLAALAAAIVAYVLTVGYQKRQEAYYTDLAHRTLADAGAAMAAEIEATDVALGNLLDAAEKETAPPNEADDQRQKRFDTYIRQILDHTGSQSASGEGTPLFLYRKTSLAKQPVEFRTTFDQLAAQPVARLFDDFIVAHAKDGSVLYQKSHEGQRWNNVSFLNARKDPPKQSSLAGLLTETDESAFETKFHTFQTEVRLRAEDVRLAREADSGKAIDVTVIGLFKKSRLTSEELAFPFTYSLLFFFLTLGAVFAVPVVRVAMLQPLQRLKRSDGVWIAGSVFFTGSLLTFALLTVTFYSVGLDGEVDRRLYHLWGLIEKNVTQEFRGNLDILAAHQQEHCTGACKNAVENDLGAAWAGKIDWAKKLREQPKQTDRLTRRLEQIFWADREGQQRAKFTLAPITPPLVPVKDRAFFRAIVEHQGWKDLGTPAERQAPFYVESLFSITSGENTAVLSRPFGEHAPPPAPAEEDVPLRVAVVTSRPLSLFGTFVPPGLGFAIIGPDGKILFHSEETRNLRENLFDELMDAAPLRSAMFAHTPVDFKTTYNGEDHSFHAQPVANFAGSGWTLGVYSATDVFRNALAAITTFSVSFYAIYAVAISVVVGLLLWSMAERGAPRSWNPLARLWPNHKKYGGYEGFIAAFLAALFVYAVCLFSLPPGWLMLATLVLPAAGIAGGRALNRRCVEGKTQLSTWLPPGISRRGRFTLAAALFVQLTAIMPCTAFYRIAFDQEMRSLDKREQLQLVEHFQKRRQAVESAVRKWGIPEHGHPEFIAHQMRAEREFGVYSRSKDLEPSSICVNEGSAGLEKFQHTVA